MTKKFLFSISILFIFVLFSCLSCQKSNNSNSNVFKKIITEKERTDEQNFMLNSFFFDIDQMANTIWLSCLMYGDEGYPYYVDSKNKVLVLRKNFGIKNVEIGKSTKYDIIDIIGYPDEVENENKYIYKKIDNKIEHLMIFFFDNDLLTNIEYIYE